MKKTAYKIFEGYGLLRQALGAWTNCAPGADRAHSGAQNLWGPPDFLGAHILLCKKKKNHLIYKFPVKYIKEWKSYSETKKHDFGTIFFFSKFFKLLEIWKYDLVST